jgi:glutamine synthetase
LHKRAGLFLVLGLLRFDERDRARQRRPVAFRHPFGKRLDIDMYTEGHKIADAKRLPLNLLDALRALDKSAVLRAGLGDGFVSAYLKLKQADWNEYAGHLTEWERRTTLDC